MLTTGFSLAVLSATGFYLIYRKLPGVLRRFAQKHILITDTVAIILTYMLLDGTLTALFAAAFMGIFVSILLALAADERTSAALERMAVKLGQFKDKLVDGLAKICEKKECKSQAC